MYRNTASAYLMHNSLPSPDYTGDSDSDSEIAKELEQKRRQLDEDVARFQAQKDKEFKEFEADLKSRKRQKRSQTHLNQIDYTCHEHAKHFPSTTPPYKFSSSPHFKNGRSNHTRQSSASILLMKPIAGPKVTTPTISLDPTNIRGETIQQSHALPTPPTPSAAVPSSATHNVATFSDHSKPSSKPPQSPEEHDEHTFNGVFVPSYLPLLDSVNDQASDNLVEGTQTEPASPTDRLTIDSMSIHASSLPLESSLSSDFHVTTSKRSYTSPSAVSRAILPPIIRNGDGKKHSGGKRKHVTFQLADRAIVEPSSSYEEGPSPDVDEKDSNDGKESTSSTRSSTPDNDSPRPQVTRRSTPLDPFGRRRKNTGPPKTSPDEIGMGMGDLLLNANKKGSEHLPEDDLKEARMQPVNTEAEEGYFSPKHGTSNVASTQPHVIPSNSPNSEENAESFNSFTGVDDDAYLNKRRDQIKQRCSVRKNSGELLLKTAQVCELNKVTSMTSPGASTHRPLYPGSLADSISDSANVGFFELDEELASPDAGTPKPYDIATTEGGDDSGHITTRTMRQNRKTPDDMLTGTSVPIDIVRPGSAFVSNSWIGTFGH